MERQPDSYTDKSFVGRDGVSYKLKQSEDGGPYYLSYHQIVDEPPYGDQFHKFVEIIDSQNGETIKTNDQGNSLVW